MDIVRLLYLLIKNIIEKKYSINIQNIKFIEININTDLQKEQFGDLNTNIALILAKELQKNPHQIAQEIQNDLQHGFIDYVDIAGPGFLNIFLTQDAFKNLAKSIFMQGEDFFRDFQLTCENYSIEFVSANPTGPLHIGHGRGGIIGDVLGNILDFSGHKVTKEFYINDAGSQIQKLGQSFQIRCLNQLGQNIPLPEDSYQGEYLIELAKNCVREYGYELITKDIDFFAQYAKNHLLEQIKETLTKYGITYDVWFSEKTLHQDGSIEKAIKKLEDNGFIYKKDNALWFISTQFGDDKDRVVKKSSGELTYVAADIAYTENKIKRGADHLIYILGQDHHSYVKRLKGVMQALGYDSEKLDVILYQLVTLKESGEILRLSKRAGRIITLEDIINTVGSDVARFFYLNKKADAHLDFDITLALKQTEENPVYYIQYAYVRTKSILQKAQLEKNLCSIGQEDYEYIGNSEKAILRKILALKPLILLMSKNYQIHLLTYYVLELAQLFHKYYAIHRVIDLENIKQSRGRLFTTLLVQRTLKLCFRLLGLSLPEKM